MRIIPVFLLLASVFAFCSDDMPPIFVAGSSGGGSGDFSPGATNAVLEASYLYTNALSNNLMTVYHNDLSFADGLRAIVDGTVIPPNASVSALQNSSVIVTNFYSGSNLDISVDLLSATPDLVSASVTESADRYFVINFSFEETTSAVDFFLALSCSKVNAGPSVSSVFKHFHFTYTPSPAK